MPAGVDKDRRMQGRSYIGIFIALGAAAGAGIGYAVGSILIGDFDAEAVIVCGGRLTKDAEIV